MAHDVVGIKNIEVSHDHHHNHHGDAASQAKTASFWLFVILAGGLLILTSYYVQWASPTTEIVGATETGHTEIQTDYLWQFHMDLVALIGAILLSIPVLWHALKGLIQGHRHMDELVALAIIAAFGIQDYRVAGVIAFFLLLSELVETRTAIGARASIEDLIKLTPKTARLVTEDGEAEVEATSLKMGQRVAVRPGDNIPADGKVVKGQSTINQATITGESMPVDKTTGDPVFSGTTNLTGALEIEVTKVGSDTTLGRVQELILMAEKTRIPIMRIIDQYVVWYTPVILMLAGLVLFFTQEDKGIERAISMLVASCPCALIMATPTAMVAGLSCAARLGILIKDVAHLESAGRLTAVIFDKTGTLTTGELSVTQLIPVEGVEGATLVTAAAVAEQQSNHPVARAVVNIAAEANVQYDKPDSFEEIHGKGVIAKLNGEEILVGRELFLKEKGLDTNSVKHLADQAEGMSLLYVARGGKLLGVVGLEDMTRTAARDAVEELREIGIRRLAMLTGDRHVVARKVAAEMACTEFKADCLPHEKLDLVHEMQSHGHRVMVIGDGVNDAPALAAGDLGVAMGAAGSDVAINSASIALLNNDLTRIPFLIRLSRATRKVVVQNLVFGVFFVATVMTLGAMALVSPITVAILHLTSTFFVVFNSARLVRFGEEKATHDQIIADEMAPTGKPATA